jgi:isopenicillin-N N-acyltransferase-like protein
VDEAAMRAYAGRHEPHIRAVAPHLLEEMHGIAEGANLPFATILALACVAEIRRLRLPAVRGRCRPGPCSAASPTTPITPSASAAMWHRASRRANPARR